MEITLVGEIERVKKLLVDNEKFDIVKATNKTKTGDENDESNAFAEFVDELQDAADLAGEIGDDAAEAGAP